MTGADGNPALSVEIVNALLRGKRRTERATREIPDLPSENHVSIDEIPVHLALLERRVASERALADAYDEEVATCERYLPQVDSERGQQALQDVITVGREYAAHFRARADSNEAEWLRLVDAHGADLEELDREKARRIQANAVRRAAADALEREHQAALREPLGAEHDPKCNVCRKRDVAVRIGPVGYCKRCGHAAGVMPHGKIT